MNLGGKKEVSFIGQTTALNARAFLSLLPSQLLVAVMELTDVSASAVDMAQQQQAEQICWSSNNSVMSLGMWSPLYAAVVAHSAVMDRAVPVHLGLAPGSCQGSFCAHSAFGEHSGAGLLLLSFFSNV